MAKIQYLWPDSEVYGIELVSRIVEIGANHTNIIQGNIETMEIPYAKEQFDYIILADVLEHLYEPGKTLARLLPYLKTGGSFLCSMPNIMHTSVLLPLLQGNFDYSDSGICDRTHIRFFTLNSIAKMFQELGLVIDNLTANLGGLPTEEEEQLLNFLEEIPSLAPKAQFQVNQYIFSAKKK